MKTLARGGESAILRLLLGAVLSAVLAAQVAGCGGEGSGMRAELGGGAGSGGESGAVADTALDRMLDEILPRMERSSGLSATRRPRLARSDAARLERYLLERFEEQLPAERASTLTRVYARFGLVPDTLDLRATLLRLYREQVVGYYDPRTDTLFVLESVPREQLQAVLAHELVHALQDQHVDLDSLTTAVEGENDRRTAVQAAVEGHATLAMLEWQLGLIGQAEVDVTALPDLAETLGAVAPEALGEAAGLPALGRAPRIIREALLFPYIGGLGFVQRLWKTHEGRPAPFGPYLPLSTEQVLHPDRFLNAERDSPTRVRFASDLAPAWESLYEDGLGELEIRVFLEEHLGDPNRAAAAAAGWDGDLYRLLNAPAGEVLLWVSVWDSAAEASEFATAAREAWAHRYGVAASGGGSIQAAGRRVEIHRAAVSGLPAVTVVDRPESLDAEVAERAAAARTEGG